MKIQIKSLKNKSNSFRHQKKRKKECQKSWKQKSITKLLLGFLTPSFRLKFLKQNISTIIFWLVFAYETESSSKELTSKLCWTCAGINVSFLTSFWWVEKSGLWQDFDFWSTLETTNDYNFTEKYMDDLCDIYALGFSILM